MMNRSFIAISLISASCLLLGSNTGLFKSPGRSAGTTAQTSGMDTLKAMKNYINYCGGCHGEKMDAFVDRSWKHGKTREDMFKGIKVGYPDEGMPGFDSAFTTEEIYALADYILTGIENVNRYQFEDNVTKNNFFPESANFFLILDTVARGLKSVWGMAFLPDGQLLITEKGGKIYRVSKKSEMKEITGGPTVTSDGQGGLMDVVLHPDYKKNKLVYFTYSAIKKEGSASLATTAILRAKLEGDKLTDQKIIFEAFPYTRARHHYGSRMVFDREGYLFFSVGERGNEQENPQTLKNDLGKIHRIKDDGSIPADNPFVQTEGARPSIWSYGHRNPQGLTLHPKTGEIWSNEHGPRGGDEVNIIKKGANYGWPVISYGINYNGKIITNKTAQEGMEQPVLYWIPSIGPSGMAFIEGNRYRGWEGQLLSGSLRFKYLNLTTLKDQQVVREEMLLKNVGRFRDIRMGPNGYIYVSVENPGYVFRLNPINK